MTDQQIIIQYRFASFGGIAELERRHQIEDILGPALESADIGYCDGGDIGNGSINIFLFTHDRRPAEQLVIRTLRAKNMLEGAVIAIRRDVRANEPFEVVWPEDYEGEFSVR